MHFVSGANLPDSAQFRLYVRQRRCDAVRDPFNLAEERLLFKFATDADLCRWNSFQDKDVGGKSTISLEASANDPVSTALQSSYYEFSKLVQRRRMLVHKKKRNACTCIFTRQTDYAVHRT